jgi:fumarate reductase flavoprotein subunit
MTEPRNLPTRCEVLVLGAGIAGHCAALAAAEAGADVLFLEEAPQPGGSSAMAGGIFLFTGTDLQTTYEFLRGHGVKFHLAPSKPPAPARSHHTGTGRSTTALHEAALGNPRIRFFANAAGARLCRSPETGRVDGSIVTYNGRETKSM